MKTKIEEAFIGGATGCFIYPWDSSDFWQMGLNSIMAFKCSGKAHDHSHFVLAIALGPKLL